MKPLSRQLKNSEIMASEKTIQLDQPDKKLLVGGLALAGILLAHHGLKGPDVQEIAQRRTGIID